MKPSIGRIVHVFAGDSRTPTAAIITYVHSDSLVNLTMFPDRGVPTIATSVTLFEGQTQATEALDVNIDRVAAFWPPKV
jgi:hypothetical protein